jgi:Putative Ig domain
MQSIYCVSVPQPAAGRCGQEAAPGSAVPWPCGPRGLASPLSFFRISSIALRDALAQERDKNPACVVNPFGYSSPKGAAVSFTMQAMDSHASQTLTFTATGLPSGITIAASGTISGSSSTLGTYTVTVTATDTEGVSGTAAFVWSVVQ